jgi:hypothetical protein
MAGHHAKSKGTCARVPRGHLAWTALLTSEQHEVECERTCGRTSAAMGADAHVPSCTRETLALVIRNVVPSLGVAPELGHAKVDHVDDVGGAGAGKADKEVIGLDVALDEVLFVNRLHA